MNTSTHVLSTVELNTSQILDPLTDSEENFAKVWASSGNKGKAYRTAYNVRPSTLPASVWAQASEISCRPRVIARYNELRRLAADQTIFDIREMMQWQYDVATADPNELVRTVAHNCRHCHGVNFEYQWKNDIEYLDACTAALDAKAKVLPSEAGGYGFTPMIEPNSICPYCYGAGIPVTIIADTTKLEGKARKLYAGCKINRHGEIEIKMHDQQAAWDMLHKMMGAYKVEFDPRTPLQRDMAERRLENVGPVTAESARKSYLELLSAS